MNVMRHTVLLTCLFLILLGSALSAAEKAPVAISAHHLRWASNIEMMRGHIVASLDNLRLGKKERVRAHASHPLEEHYDLLSLALRARNPDFEAQLRNSLDGMGRLLHSKFSTESYEQEVGKLSALLDRALQMLIPSDVLAEPKFQAALIARLCQTASQEYSEAVRDVHQFKLEEYQDAFAFVQRAQILAQKIKGHLSPLALRQLRQLQEALPTITPPATLVPTEEVSKSARRLASAIKQSSGTRRSRRGSRGPLMSPLIVIKDRSIRVDPAEEIAAIRGLLDQIKKTYRRGDVQKARELSAVLYLEHYEKIEGEVFDKVPKLNEKVELILGVKIRNLIKTKAPPSEMDAQIAKVLPTLREIEKALTHK
jgi:hypothetical protein